MIKNANISETVQDIDIVTTAATVWAKEVSHKLLKIYILQGCVATQLRCSGIFNNHFIINFPRNVPVKNFENRSKFGEDMDKSGLLFGPPCTYRMLAVELRHYQ